MTLRTLATSMLCKVEILGASVMVARVLTKEILLVGRIKGLTLSALSIDHICQILMLNNERHRIPNIGFTTITTNV